MSWMNSMIGKRGIRHLQPWLFPLGVAAIYSAGLILAPEKSENALLVCGSMLRQLALPVGIAVVMMAVLNLVLSPALVTKYLGRKTGLRGVVLSSLAGILSMGPIYAWYPLFKTLKEKGASAFIIANFIGSRSVKPVLLPVLVAYFGWDYTVIFVLLCLAGALATAAIVNFFCPETSEAWDHDQT